MTVRPGPVPPRFNSQARYRVHCGSIETCSQFRDHSSVGDNLAARDWEQRTMAQDRTIDVDRLVDDQRLTSFNWMLVFWCFVVSLIDGYDISAAPAAGPFFVRDWHLASPAALTAPFSATNFGVLFGAPLFGWIGDRFGRKPAIILSLLTFGLLTLLVALASSVEQLTWARFFTGFGVGGVIANTIALNAEMAPARVRATLIILMFVGTTLA